MNHAVSLIFSVLGVSYLTWQAVVSTRKLRSLKTLLTTIEGQKARNQHELREAFKQYRSDYSDWTLIQIADKHKWSKEIVSALPSLYFDPGTDDSIYVWREVYRLIPEDIKCKQIGSLCEGELLKVSIPTDSQNLVGEIAKSIESARINNPFVTNSSLFGVINQHFIDFELDAQNRKDKTLERSFVRERMEILNNNLQLIDQKGNQ